MAPTRRRNWSHVLLIALITCGITGASYLAYKLGYYRTADYLFYDLRMHWRGPLQPSGDVVLVLMDDTSARELGRRKGSWSRAHLADALENLCRARAEIIGLDMIFASPDPDSEVDQRLAQIIYDCNNVVLARILSGPGTAEVTPLPALQNAMIGDGYIDFDLDQDGVLRRIRFLNAKPHAGGGIQLLPAFSLELARTYRNVDFTFDFSRDDRITMGNEGEQQLWLPYPELLINYIGTYRELPTLSFADVVRDRFPSESVAGKVVLIGSSLVLQKDFLTTPVSRFHRSPKTYEEQFGEILELVESRKDVGVSIHANAVETILGQRFLVALPENWTIALAVFSGLFGLLFYIPRLRLAWSGAILAVTLVCIVAMGYLIFRYLQLSADVTQSLIIISGQFVAGVAYQRRLAKARAAFVQNLFGKYVSPDVVRNLVEGRTELSLEGHRCELTVLFSDLRGFTSLSEQLDARQTGVLLNQYFNTVIPAVFDHGGTIDKLMGDAIMAFFGAPVRFEDHANRAAAAALAMLESLQGFRNSGIPGADRLFVGVGINTGTVILGNLGSDQFMDYTVIGDAVNLGSRLEGLNKVYGTEIIVSDTSAQQLDERLLLRELDLVQVKGKETAVRIYELLGYTERVDARRRRAAELFEAGLALYREQRWGDAGLAFEKTLRQSPNDRAARLYLERIEEHKNADLPDGWAGVTVFDHK
jgi:adenylate cyclase